MKNHHKKIDLSLIVILTLLFSISLSAHAATETIQYSYDNSGQIQGVSYDGTTVVEYVYDNMGNRMIKSTSTTGAPVNNQWGQIFIIDKLALNNKRRGIIKLYRYETINMKDLTPFNTLHQILCLVCLISSADRLIFGFWGEPYSVFWEVHNKYPHLLLTL